MAKLKTHFQYEMELLERELDYWPTECYVNADTPIMHECIKGHRWLARPSNILRGSKCGKCSKPKTTDKYLSDLKAKNIDYRPIEEYIGAKIPIEHVCNKGHVWKAQPSSILGGSSCPTCSKVAFDVNAPAICYYVKIGDFYKVGITNRNVQTRFKPDKDKKLIVLGTKTFENGRAAKLFEAEILSSVDRVCVPNYLRGGGNTELFLEPLNELNLQRFQETEVPSIPAPE